MFAQGSSLQFIKRSRVITDAPVKLERTFIEIPMESFDVLETSKATVRRLRLRGGIELSKHSIQLMWNPALFQFGEISVPTTLFPGTQELEIAIRPFDTKLPLPELDYMVRLGVILNPII